MISPARHVCARIAFRETVVLLKRRSEQVDVLKQVALFTELSRKQLAMLAGLSTQVARPANSVLAQQGRRGRELVLIVDGRARVERDGSAVATLGPGDCFGEISLIDGGPRTATVVAETPCDLLVVEARAFRTLVETAPTLAIQLMKNLCARLREAQSSVNA
jgi:CRP-like cAMP-binding protein